MIFKTRLRDARESRCANLMHTLAFIFWPPAMSRQSEKDLCTHAHSTVTKSSHYTY